ncbi:MAG TPA: PIN domain-containing protein [Acidobacteriota bacterium]|nr:PIN domain-containing protein [Acidobacteriota bacterium]
MVLADTSIWVRHLRLGDLDLMHLLRAEKVLTHPFVLTELGTRRLDRGDEILRLLRTLPGAVVADTHEVDRMIEDRELAGLGLGLVDVHLLASALLSDARLWSSDRRLREVAAELELGID